MSQCRRALTLNTNTKNIWRCASQRGLVIRCFFLCYLFAEAFVSVLPQTVSWLAVVVRHSSFSPYPFPLFVIAPIHDFVKSLATAITALRSFRKLSRRCMVTRPWRECRYKWLTKGEGQETGITEKRHHRAKVENDQWESVRNSLKPMACRIKQFTAVFTRICNSQRSRPGGWPNCWRRRWREESQYNRGIHTDYSHLFLTNLDNILIVGESPGGEGELAGLTLTQEAS